MIVSQILVIDYQARNEIGGFELPIWFAPALWRRSEQGVLLLLLRYQQMNTATQNSGLPS
ncbi:hypothetical protein OK016_00330 [Vibrio chagasii]|nr:hypothetical protein [Vibrio chagasii]